MPRAKYLIAAGFCAGLLSSGVSRSAEWESGPFIHEFQLTLSPGRRIEAIGPLFSHEQSEGRAQWAFHPLLSHTVESGADAEEFDLAYPLLTYDRFGTEYRFQILQVFSFSGGRNQQ